MPFEFLSLSGSLTRAHALESLLAASTLDHEDAELCINATMVERVDVVAATATRMRLARHQREHPTGHASIWLPRRSATAARYADMLSPLPDRVDFGQRFPNTPAPTHYTLVPATQIPDSEAAVLAGEYVFDVCRRARISRRRAGYIAAAAMELADNAVVHAPAALDVPVLAVNSFGRARVVELAVTDAGTAVSDADDPITIVRSIPGRAIAGERGFLGQILRRGRQAGLDVTVEVMAGVAHLVWTTTRHRTIRARYVPGMTVVARIGA
jgi:anti-sigma regulatory factor (Ser/Thr protein kinase)